jgi:hypothetical protein
LAIEQLSEKSEDKLVYCEFNLVIRIVFHGVFL